MKAWSIKNNFDRFQRMSEIDKKIKLFSQKIGQLTKEKTFLEQSLKQFPESQYSPKQIGQNFKVNFPLTQDTVSISFIVSDKLKETKEKEALRYYNSMRKLNNLKSIKEFPNGTEFIKL